MNNNTFNSEDRLTSEDLIQDKRYNVNISNTEEINNDIEDLNEMYRRFQILKEGNKMIEKAAKQTEHRINLLHNQEKIADRKLEMTRRKFEDVLNNKIENFDNKRDLNKTKILKKSVDKIKGNLNKTMHRNSKNKTKSEIMKEKEIEKLNAQKEKEEGLKQLILEKKNKLKEEILKRIQIEEEERLKLEDELADVRSEEIRIVNLLNQDDIRKIQK